MNVLVTICGRAGSKGVINKNIREFLGHSLLKYSLAAAFLFKENLSRYNSDICVNSDSDIILDMAGLYGLPCIKRPPELAQDTSPKIPSVRYSLECMEKMLDKRYDYVMDLDITSPLRKWTDMENGMNKIIGNSGLDVVFSVVPSRRNPYFNMVEEHNGRVRKIISANIQTRQQAPKTFDMNASIYCYRRESLLCRLKHSPTEGNFDIFIMKDTAVLDIDSEEDFVLMEVLARYFFQNEFKEIYDYTCNRLCRHIKHLG